MQLYHCLGVDYLCPSLIIPMGSNMRNGTCCSLHCSCEHVPTLSVAYCCSSQQMQHNQHSNHSVLCYLASGVSSRRDATFLTLHKQRAERHRPWQSASTGSTKQVHTFRQKAGCDFNRKDPGTNAANLDTDVTLLYCELHCFCII